eukprot:364824-Chlamydomonas_euryale.AAC.11
MSDRLGRAHQEAQQLRSEREDMYAQVGRAGALRAAETAGGGGGVDWALVWRKGAEGRAALKVEGSPTPERSILACSCSRAAAWWSMPQHGCWSVSKFRRSGSDSLHAAFMQPSCSFYAAFMQRAAPCERAPLASGHSTTHPCMYATIKAIPSCSPLRLWTHHLCILVKEIEGMLAMAATAGLGKDASSKALQEQLMRAQSDLRLVWRWHARICQCVVKSLIIGAKLKDLHRLETVREQCGRSSLVEGSRTVPSVDGELIVNGLGLLAAADAEDGRLEQLKLGPGPRNIKEFLGCTALQIRGCHEEGGGTTFRDFLNLPEHTKLIPWPEILAAAAERAWDWQAWRDAIKTLLRWNLNIPDSLDV